MHGHEAGIITLTYKTGQAPVRGVSFGIDAKPVALPAIGQRP